MKKLLIEIEVGEGFKNHGEAFDFLHKELPCFNFEMGGPISVSRNQNVEQSEGTIVGRWEVRELRQSRKAAA
jgi:hypothetical protein